MVKFIKFVVKCLVGFAVGSVLFALGMMLTGGNPGIFGVLFWLSIIGGFAWGLQDLISSDSSGGLS